MNNKNLPILIIGLVLVAAVIGGILLYRNQTAPTGNTNSNKPANKAASQDFAKLLTNAPPGAQPAWSKGDPAARVTIEEFGDFSCPTCAGFHQVLKEVEKTYGSRVKVIFRHFTLQIRGHENSYDAARAAEAAGLQNRFWEMQNMLFTNQKSWALSSEADARKAFTDYAKSIGIDAEKFQTDMLSGQVATARVRDDMKRGQALNINSTPTVILNGRLLANNEISSIETLRQIIEGELQKTQGPVNPTGNPPATSAQNSSNQNTP